MVWGKIKKVLKFTFTGFLALFVVSFTAFLFLSRDEPPPDDSDLQVKYANIGDEKNAYFWFKKAAQKLYWPKEKDKRIWNTNENNWDQQFLNEFLHKNQDALGHVEKGLGCSKSQFPQIHSTKDELSISSSLTHFSKLGQLVSLKAISLYRAGNQKEGFDEAMKIVKFAHLIENSNGTLSTQTNSQALKKQGIRILQMLLKDTVVKQKDLQNYIQELARYKVSDEGLANSFRVEYVRTANNFSQLTKGRNLLDRLYMRYAVQPNKTNKMFAKAYRLFIMSVSGYYNELELPSEKDGSAIKIILFPVFPNSIGDLFHNMAVGNEKWILYRKYNVDFLVSGTRLLFAIKCFQTDTGKLPMTLDELVPQCIPKLPPDPFDGKPLRYSREKKLIWSVGTDLKDSGGRKTAEAMEMAEPSLKIEF